MFKAARALALILLLACSARAGHVPNEEPAPPPPDPVVVETTEDVPSVTPTNVAASLAQVVTGLLAVMPSLL